MTLRCARGPLCYPSIHPCRRDAPAAGGPRESLVPQTLEDMEGDTELQQHLQRLSESGQQALTREEKMKRQRSLDNLGVPSFYAVCKVRGVARGGGTRGRYMGR